jgi:hypothetical protein
MARPAETDPVIEQNVWAYAYEEIMAQTLLTKNKGLESEIEAHAIQHADERLAQWRAGRESE